MSDEQRMKRLGLRWGLVALGAISYCAVRFFVVMLDELTVIQHDTDWRILTARLSQLKPEAFKAGPLQTYFWLLVTLCVLAGVGMLVVAVDAIRRPPDDPEP
jgi:hypothetical protein